MNEDKMAYDKINLTNAGWTLIQSGNEQITVQNASLANGVYLNTSAAEDEPPEDSVGFILQPGGGLVDTAVSVIGVGDSVWAKSWSITGSVVLRRRFN
jgi:hypothetical protein